MSEDKRKEDPRRTYSNKTFYVDASEEFNSKCKSAAKVLQKSRQLSSLLGTGIGSPYRAASNYGARFISSSSPNKTNMNEFSQRIMSAKLLRVKQLQNELTDAQFQLNELFKENRLLKTIQKRQELALSKYEGTKAELPQLIRSHNEEVRILRAMVKQLRSQCNEKDHRVKELDADFQNLRDQHHHLLKLSRNRHLGDREQLTKQVEELKEVINEQDVKIQTLNRKIMLETKSLKHKLSTEMAQHKETQRDLSVALDKISKLEILIEAKEKYIGTLVPNRNFQNYNRQPGSLVLLSGPASYPDLHTSMKYKAELIPQLEEESSEGTLMASHTNTSYGSTYPHTDALQINSENHMPSDGYNARRIKLQNKRKDMLGRKLDETMINETDDMSSSGLTSPTPSSSGLNDDTDTDLMDENASIQPYSFGTVYRPRKSANTEPARKLSQDKRKSTGNCSVDDNTHKSEDSMKSQNAELPEKESKDSDTYTKTSSRESFQENGRKDVFTNLMADTKKETEDGKDLLLSVELMSIENGLKETLSVNKSRRGSLVMEKLNFVEEKSMPTITNRSLGRRGSLVREKRNSTTEETMPAINSTGRNGSLKREKINFIQKQSIPGIRIKSGSRRASLNNEINLDTDSVIYAASNVMETSDADGTKNGVLSEYRLGEASERLSEISQTYNKIQNISLTEREVTEAKLKQVVSKADSKALETRGYEKKKLLAALKAIDDGEDPSIFNPGDNSSILDSLVNNSISDPESSLNISLPFIGQTGVLDHQWEGKVVSKERKTGVGHPKTKTELMQELFGGHSEDLTVRSNNNA